MELQGFRKRWANAGAAPASPSVHPGGPLLSEPDLDVISDNPEAAVDTESNVSDSLLEPSASSCSRHVEQTGVVTALSVLRSAKRVKLPWESGPLAPLFNSESFNKRFDLKPTHIGIADVLNPRPKERAAPLVTQEISAPSRLVRKRIALVRYNVQDDELRSRALNRFRVLISLDFHATATGTAMLDSLGMISTDTDTMQMLSDSLSNKATGTLLKRSSSLWRWANWVATCGTGTCFDQPEAVVYEYLNFLRNSGAAPTAASHFIEALRFADQVFRLTKMNTGSILSSRVTGAAHSMFLQKQKLRQAPAFPVDAVATFEALCIGDPRRHVRVICGGIMFCIFACVRWFDAMRIESVWIDKFITMCLLEAETSRHKTSMTKESKTRLLPYTCIGNFLLDSSWAQSFMTAREECGFDDNSPFLPSWNEVQQTWSSYPMSSGEATCWIREFLHGVVTDPEKYSSHGCKCTVLTWAGMCTLFTREERTLLGHHVEPQTRSSTTYSRDSQILLQYKVVKLVGLIRSGRLKPDVSRAERLNMLVQQGPQCEDPELSETWEEPQLVVSDEHSDDADTEHHDEVLDALNDSVEVLRDPVPADSGEFQWYVHTFTGVAHAASKSDSSGDLKLLCGRYITVNLKQADRNGLDLKTSLLCIQCNSALKKSHHDSPTFDLSKEDATVSS